MTTQLTTTTDPLDAGNEPGKGPLRAGGQSVDNEPALKGDRPSTLSKRAQEQQSAMRLCRDLWGGNQTVKGATETYLPKADGETPRNYGARLSRSVFFNVFRQTVIGLVGLIFRKDPVLNADVPDVVREHWKNIDLAGTHGDVFCKELEQDAMTVGHAAILVEFPTTEPGLTRAEEMELRPYWVPIRKDQILSWRTASIEGVTALVQVVIQMDTWAPNGRFGEVMATRYLLITREPKALVDPVRWSMLEVTPNNVVVTVAEGIYANQSEIPLSEVVTSGRKSLFDSAPPLVDVAYLNVAHYQMWSDYANSIHKTCVPVLALLGVDVSRDDNGQPVQGIVVGPNTVITIPNAQGDVKYASHSGDSIEAVENALENLKSDMGALGLAMLAPQKRSAETAEAKRLDKSTSDSALAATARGLQDAVDRALGFHAAYMKIDSAGTVSINRDFDGILMEAPVMEAYGSLVEQGFPPRIVLQALRDGGRIPEDEDIDVLEVEFEANRLAEQEAKSELPAEVDEDGSD